MTAWHYLLLVNIYLLLFYGFYILLLRKETFFQLNRVYLVAASLLSFFIPMIQSNWVKNLFITRQVELTIYNSPLVVYQFKPIQHTQITIGQVLAIVYLVGMLFLIGRFIWQMIVLNKIINQPDAAVAYSFFKKIRLGPGQADNHIITAHERVHAKRRVLGVTFVQVARYLRWDPGTLTRYLNGTWREPPSRASQLEAFLVAEEADMAPMHRLPRRR